MNNPKVMLTDLHCHILPEIDDGAENAEISRKMLRLASDQGIRRIMFTPHFYPEMMAVEEFLEKRDAAFGSIKGFCKAENITAKLGAEIRITKDITDLALRALSYEGGTYALIELPMFCYPLWIEEIIARMNDIGIRPVLAHIERYDYLMSDLDQIYTLKDLGAVVQVNASSILRRRTHRKIKEMVKAEYIDIICSDAHDIDERSVLLADSLSVLDKADRLRLIRNAERIFNGTAIN